ncbi:MAG: D-aminoacylase, partial [Kutzneria sp.]|nr:D-aminoacylase [Kutzneria sp.]
MWSGVDSGATLLIRGAEVVDGTGATPFAADIVVDEGVITGVEVPGSVPADRFAAHLDAAGLVVCPGFIDVHSHADSSPLLDEDDLTKIRQGVTTEVTGNCGFSLAPIARGREEEFLGGLKLFTFRYTGWHRTDELFEVTAARGGVTNTCPLVGHGALRAAVLGLGSRTAGPDDVRAMGTLLTEALEAGAFGMSTGLIYPPGMYSDTEELQALASFLPADRVYATHMRSEGSGLLRSIDEALSIGRTAGCRVEISHLKSVGKANRGGITAAMGLLDRARSDGLAVTQDVYPYNASSTMLSICLPPWVHEGGKEQALRRLRDPAALVEMRRQIEDTKAPSSWERVIDGVDGYGAIVVSATASHRYEGRTLRQIADDLGIEPFDALIRVLVEERLSVMMVDFCMAEADVEAVLGSPFTAIGSDGLPVGGGGLSHPRLHGTFPRVLGRYVRSRALLELPEAVRRMTSLPAEVFAVPRRGTVETGKVADLVCFDPDSVDHPGDYANPAVPPTGIAWVMQSGHVVVDHGRWCGTRRGVR